MVLPAAVTLIGSLGGGGGAGWGIYPLGGMVFWGAVTGIPPPTGAVLLGAVTEMPPPTGAEINVYYPVGVASLLTCGSLRALLLSFFLLFVDGALYYPFFRRYDRIRYEEECKNCGG